MIICYNVIGVKRYALRVNEKRAKMNKKGQFEGMKSVKILGIANSFAEDCMEYVYEILKSLGVEEVKVAYLYFGGCSLRRHCDYAKNDTADYRLSVKTDGTWVHKEGSTAWDGVESDEWDYIFTQQCSGESGLKDTYDDLDELMGYVKAHAKGNPTYGWQMTWAYAQYFDNANFDPYERDQMKMYYAIVDAVKEKILPRTDITKIFPSGTAIQNARTALGDVLNRDGFHLDLQIGRYVAGLCVVKGLLGLDIDEVGYAPEGVDERQKEVAIKAVNAACAKPFEVTEIQ